MGARASSGFTLVEVLIAMAVAMVMAFTVASALLTLLRTERLGDTLSQAEWAIQACVCQRYTALPVTESIELPQSIWMQSELDTKAEDDPWILIRLSQKSAFSLDVYLFSGVLPSPAEVED